MSTRKYLGEVEVIDAIASIRNQVAQASSFEEALPCTADATYVDDHAGTVPATVTLDAYESKYRPHPSYKVEVFAKLPEYGVGTDLKIGTREEIVAWLDRCTHPDDVYDTLFSSYRGAWECNESIRYRDY